MKTTETAFDDQLKIEIQHILDSGPNSIRLLELFKRSYRPSICDAIERAFETSRTRGWDCTFWHFDIHETILVPNYGDAGQEETFYPLALEGLKLISERTDVVLSLYTCSWPREIREYRKFFREHGVDFKYINENRDVENSRYGYYRDKPYMNVLLDDKAGFNPHKDWAHVIDQLNKYPDGYGLMNA